MKPEFVYVAETVCGRFVKAGCSYTPYIRARSFGKQLRHLGADGLQLRYVIPSEVLSEALLLDSLRPFAFHYSRWKFPTATEWHDSDAAIWEIMREYSAFAIPADFPAYYPRWSPMFVNLSRQKGLRRFLR